MNEYINYLELEVGQSSKGHWYCKNLKVVYNAVEGLLVDTDEAMDGVEKLCDKYNNKLTDKTIEEGIDNIPSSNQ